MTPKQALRTAKANRARKAARKAALFIPFIPAAPKFYFHDEQMSFAVPEADAMLAFSEVNDPNSWSPSK